MYSVEVQVMPGEWRTLASNCSASHAFRYCVFLRGSHSLFQKSLLRVVYWGPRASGHLGGYA